MLRSGLCGRMCWRERYPRSERYPKKREGVGNARHERRRRYFSFLVLVAQERSSRRNELHYAPTMDKKNR